MNALQLFNELFFVATFLTLIVTLIILAVVALARYRIEVHQVGENVARIGRLEVRMDTYCTKKEED